MSRVLPAAAFDEAMLQARSQEVQRQIEQEVCLLARTFAPAGEAAQFDAAADALDEVCTVTSSRHHLRLWAAGFRRLARGKA